jgi:hypothetical protein
VHAVQEQKIADSEIVSLSASWRAFQTFGGIERKKIVPKKKTGCQSTRSHNLFVILALLYCVVR